MVRKIAFQSNRDGNYEIYVMNADASGMARLTNDPGQDGEPAWSPTVLGWRSRAHEPVPKASGS